MSDLTHFNQAGEAHMVDVGSKAVTERVAVAEGRIVMLAETLDLIQQGGHKKGDVIDFEVVETEQTVVCRAEVATSGQTGVEMEALTAVQVALLTIYDMCKAVDRGMVMTQVQLIEKAGGKSGHWLREQA